MIQTLVSSLEVSQLFQNRPWNLNYPSVPAEVPFCQFIAWKGLFGEARVMPPVRLYLFCRKFDDFSIPGFRSGTSLYALNASNFKAGKLRTLYLILKQPKDILNKFLLKASSPRLAVKTCTTHYTLSFLPFHELNCFAKVLFLCLVVPPTAILSQPCEFPLTHCSSTTSCPSNSATRPLSSTTGSNFPNKRANNASFATTVCFLKGILL